ncbi:Splicing factor 3B subunit 3, partial [Geodia barretti]
CHWRKGETFFFAPRPLKNLVLVDELESLSPIMSAHISDLANEDTPQLYLACGRGPRSSLRVLRHGLEVTEMAVSELPGNPNAVWTVKTNAAEEFDAYIVVSFTNATLVLSIGETVEEVTDSGFLGTTPTLACSRLGDDALIQVYPEGIRHIRADKRVNEWKSPGKRAILKCALNDHQVVIALTGGELVYFEMDLSGQLNEYTERKEMMADVVCMSLGSVPPGEQRSRFLSVGLSDQTVRIISLDPSDTLQPLSMQALPALPESLCLVEMGGGGREGDGGLGTVGGLYLNIGLTNGVLLRTALDAITGDLSDTRTRYLGTRPVKLFRVRMHGSESVLAVSSRSWLSYSYQSRFHLTPLSYDVLDYASGFSSEQCPEGIVAIAANTLRILSLEKLGVVFNQVATPLNYTPRKLAVHPPSANLLVIETDHNTFTEAAKTARKQQIAEEMVQMAGEEEQEAAAEAAETFLSEDLPENLFGAVKAGAGMWSSCLKVMHPTEGKTLELVQFQQNEAAFSLAVCQFASRGDVEWFVVVGTARDLTLAPKTCSGGSLILFRMSPDGSKLEHVHSTPLDDIPVAMHPFQGRLLVGVGHLLRIYDIGKKKMLRK